MRNPQLYVSGKRLIHSDRMFPDYVIPMSGMLFECFALVSSPYRLILYRAIQRFQIVFWSWLGITSVAIFSHNFIEIARVFHSHFFHVKRYPMSCCHLEWIGYYLNCTWVTWLGILWWWPLIIRLLPIWWIVLGHVTGIINGLTM